MSTVPQDVQNAIQKKQPTTKHRLAISPGILGTVYGINEHGECRYFDYDWAAAYEFAGVTTTSDPRRSVPLVRSRAMYVKSGAFWGNPSPSTVCIWVRG